MQLRPDRIGIAKPELGEYDRDIICRDCDNKLGVFDDYAIDVCRAFKKKHTRDGKLFAILNIDDDKLAKFILAVLWRASISKRESFFGIRLGPYEPQARDVLFGAAPLSSLRAFQVIAQRYENEKISVESIASYPVRHGKGAWNVYSLSVGGFGFIAKLDNRPFLGD